MTVTNCYDARYFAVGSADSLVSLWNVKELLCIRTFTKLEYVPLAQLYYVTLLDGNSFEWLYISKI